MAVIKGKLFWVFTSKKNEMSDKYQLEVGRLGKAAVQKLEDMGVTVKTDRKVEKDDPNYKGRFVTLKSAKPIKVVDSKKNTIPGDVLIGNGSVANVQVSSYEWTFGGKKGISPCLANLKDGGAAIQVLELIEYKPEAPKQDNELVEEDGFVVDEDGEDINDDEVEVDDEEFDEEEEIDD